MMNTNCKAIGESFPCCHIATETERHLQYDMFFKTKTNESHPSCTITRISIARIQSSLYSGVSRDFYYHTYFVSDPIK
jgi:hypothetical protein